MNLVVDIGNTLIKVAVVEDADVLLSQTFASVDEVPLRELRERFPAMSKSIVASTGEPTEHIAERLRGVGFQVLEMTSLTPTPIGNDYLTPATLGVDRLAAAVAAVEVMGCRDCVIVDFGTAITIDLVEDGIFRGGNISPGMTTRFRSLHDYTKRLPECEPTEAVLTVGRSTREAIEQGVMQGIVDEIEGYIERFMHTNAKLSLIFTGGDAKYFVKRIKKAKFAKCNLVFCGLNRILEYNASIEDERF